MGFLGKPTAIALRWRPEDGWRMDPIRIYLIDDQAMIRAALQALLETDASFTVVGSSGDARAGVEAIRELQPDLVLLDITMPGTSGLDVVAPIKANSPGTKILMASNHEGSQYVRQALRAGADGYVSKDSEPDELRFAIRSIFRGDSYLSPRLTEAMASTAQQPADEDNPVLDRLTRREREVFQLLAIGKTNKDVAAVLTLSLGTVKKHRENLQRKLGCRSSAELARLAIREGLLRA